MADDTDFAHKPYRYRHGWVKLGGSEDQPLKGLGSEAGPGDSERGVVEIAHFLKRKLAEHKAHKVGQLSGDEKIKNAATMYGSGSKQHKEAIRRFGGGGKMPAPSEFERLAENVRAEKAKAAATKAANPGKTTEQLAAAKYYNAVKKHGRSSKQASAALHEWHRQAVMSGAVQELSNVDLATFGPARRTPRPARPAGFKRAPKPPGSEQTKFSQAALAKRASKPGHFRAKAIIAAQNGNMKAARRFEGMRQLAKAARAPMAKAPQPPKPHPSQTYRPAAPKPPRTPKPYRPRRPTGPR